MRNTANFFNVLFLIIIGILTLMSLMAISIIHWGLIETKVFSFTPTGINNYFNAFGEYKALFTSTVATIAAYFGLLRLKAATDANNDKLKQDRFSEWKTVLDIRFIEIEKYDPYMRREFTRVRYNLFQQLYKNDFSISDLKQLTQIFESNFQDIVKFLESQNNKYIGMGSVYIDNMQSYSFDSFRFLLLGCVDNTYTEIVTDLQRMYLDSMPKDRIINSELYQTSEFNYKPI